MRVRFSSSLLWLLVLVHVLVPASYYLWRDDVDDERFAWRMFSVVRLKRCMVEAWESHDPDGEVRAPIDLPRVVHASWLRLLERGRKSVIESVLVRGCSTDRGDARDPQWPPPRLTVLERYCTAPSGRALPAERYQYSCDARVFEVGP